MHHQETTVYSSPRTSRVPALHNPALFQRLKDRVKEDQRGCWIWQGSVRTDGYGQISSKRGKSPLHTHRAMWTAVHGLPPSGLFVCHACDVRLCINPEHLWLGTAADNNRDRDLKGRNPQLGMTHCYRGHEYTPDNTINTANGGKTCRICCLAATRAWRERRRIAEGRPKRSPFTSPETRAEIVRLINEGLSYRRAADRLGINVGQIYNCMSAQPAHLKPKTRLICKTGAHQMTEDNVLVVVKNNRQWRICKACKAAGRARFNAVKRHKRAAPKPEGKL